MSIVKKLSIALGLGLVVLPWGSVYAMRTDAKGMEEEESKEAGYQALSAEEQSARNKALFDAINYDDHELVRSIVASGVDFTAEDERWGGGGFATEHGRREEGGATPLMAAVLLYKKEMISLLLECKADINGPNKRGATPLDEAATYEKDDMVRTLLKAKADVGKGYCLIVAASEGHDTIVRLLLKEKADVNQADEYSFTALSAAVLKAHVKLANEDDVAPLSPAALDYHKEEIQRLFANKKKVIQTLLANKADVNASYMNKYCSPLLLWAFNLKDDSMRTREIPREIIKMLLDSKPDVNVANWGGTTPLLLAASSAGSMEVMRTSEGGRGAVLGREGEIEKVCMLLEKKLTLIEQIDEG